MLIKTRSILRNCDEYVSIIADGTSVSTFLCTRMLRPEKCKLDC